MARHLFTSESVTEGHPDKVCDQISDAVLDAIFEKDPNGRVACETCASTGLIHIMGEITTSCYVDIPKIARQVVLDIGYDRENCDKGIYHGPVHIDHYGRTVPKGAHGSAKLDNPTNLGSILISATTELFEKIADKTLTVRRITIAANRVVKDEGFFQVDLFTDTTKLEKEKKLQNAMLGLKKKFGKNAILKGTNLEEGATAKDRNAQIGGHKA